MTRARTKLLLPVLQAWADGKEVQVMTLPDGVWEDYSGNDAYFDSPTWAWRLKPEPRRWWVNVYPNQTNGVRYSNIAFPDKEMAKICASSEVLECVEVIEVLK